MAVTSVTRIPTGQPRSGAWDRLWQRRYTVCYRVECDTRDDGPVVIRTTTNGVGQPTLPIIGNSYYINATERDLGSFAESIRYELESASANPEHATWLVTVEYGPYDASLFPSNPTDWPIKVAFAGQKYQRVVWVDANSGNPIVNTAGDRFEEPALADQTRAIITVTRNELCSTFDFTLAEAYSDKINNATWNGFATGTAKVGGIIAGDPQYNSNSQVWYYAVTYPFEINRDTWNFKPLNQGYNYLDSSSPAKRVAILDKNGDQHNVPQLLDASGHVLASTGTPTYGNFQIYDAVDFSTFNLDFATALGRV